MDQKDHDQDHIDAASLDRTVTSGAECLTRPGAPTERDTFPSGARPDDHHQPVPDLPQFEVASTAEFTWGKFSEGAEALETLKNIYYEAVHWVPNLFTIPLGRVGKRVVIETSRFLRGFADGSALESVSFWAVMVMPLLSLQNPAENLPIVSVFHILSVASTLGQEDAPGNC